MQTIQRMFQKKTSLPWIMVIIGIWLWWILVWQKVLYNDTYYIQDVLFTKQSLSLYNDVNLYADIAELYSGNYYHTLHRWKRNSMLDTIQSHYSFIDTIVLQEFTANTLLLDIKFRVPLVRLRHNNSLYAVYDEEILPLFSWERLADNTPLILLPLYLSGTAESLSWILYQLNPHKLLSDYLLLQTAPVQWSLTYVPWWEKYIFRNDRLRVYFNAKKEISWQLLQLLLLYKYYPDFDRIRQIDIGSIANPIIN